MTILLFTGEKKSTHQFGCAGVLCLCAYSAAIHKKGRKSQPSLARCTPVMSNLGHLFFSLLQRWRGGRHKLTMPLFQRSYSVCLSVYTATNVCFERAYMHGTSLSLWFNMHNWSIHYCKTGTAWFFFSEDGSAMEVVDSDLEGHRFAAQFMLVIRCREMYDAFFVSTFRSFLLQTYLRMAVFISDF